MGARLLVVQHEDAAPPGWWGGWLGDAGVRLSVVPAHRGEPVPSDLRGYDGLLVLGGAMGAYDDEEFPWLAPTKRLIGHAVDTSTPLLGICLGHQLAAVALGGAVARNPAGITTGLTPVALTEAVTADPLLGGTRTGERAVHWNKDVVTRLPGASTLLATAPDGTVQAARFGRVAWGVQFHPEATPEIVASWGAVPVTGRPRVDGRGVADIVAEVAAARARLQAAWRPLAERFAEIVSSAVPVGPR